MAVSAVIADVKERGISKSCWWPLRSCEQSALHRRQSKAVNTYLGRGWRGGTVRPAASAKGSAGAHAATDGLSPAPHTPATSSKSARAWAVHASWTRAVRSSGRAIEGHGRASGSASALHPETDWSHHSASAYQGSVSEVKLILCWQSLNPQHPPGLFIVQSISSRVHYGF